MARTGQIGLPLVAPAQAQKHVTVNEAFQRLDAATQLRVLSSAMAQPPALSAEGDCFLIPVGARGEWEGRAGRIAVFANGGWMFITPKTGWRAWDESRSAYLQYGGSEWTADVVTLSPGKAATLFRVVELTHTFVAGASNLTAEVIPAGAVVIGVTGRVVMALVGTGLTSWRVGVPGFDNRYGSGLGAGLNSHVAGVTGTPMAYYSATPLLCTAEGGTFVSGQVLFAVHFLQLVPPL